jgi:TonB family protein
MTENTGSRLVSVLTLAVALMLLPGTARAADEQLVDVDKTVETARQALSVASTPEERTEASQALGCALLRKPDAEAKAEAADLFKSNMASAGENRARAGYYLALRELHRNGEAAELVSSLKAGGTKDNVTIPPCKILDSPLTAALNDYVRAIDPNAPLRMTDMVMRPEIIHQVPPVVPQQARRLRRFAGMVILEAIIDREGKVENVVRVLKGQPMGLTESAADCLRQWRFKPATLNGEPVKVFYVLTINFQIGH